MTGYPLERISRAREEFIEEILPERSLSSSQNINPTGRSL
jgi:hypothetical protein